MLLFQHPVLPVKNRVPGPWPFAFASSPC